MSDIVIMLPLLSSFDSFSQDKTLIMKSKTSWKILFFSNQYE